MTWNFLFTDNTKEFQAFFPNNPILSFPQCLPKDYPSWQRFSPDGESKNSYFSWNNQLKK
jgi:hypothetical protein